MCLLSNAGSILTSLRQTPCDSHMCCLRCSSGPQVRLAAAHITVTCPSLGLTPTLAS